MTKQQIIDALNELTDDPNEEVHAFWDGYLWPIHSIDKGGYRKRQNIIMIDCHDRPVIDDDGYVI